MSDLLSSEEHAALTGTLTAAETELAALRQQERDYIEKAREFNGLTRDTRNKATQLDRATQPLRDKLAKHNAEAKRQAAEKMKAEAAKARAEAVAKEAKAKAKEKSEADKLREENEALKAQLAAKG